MSSSKITALSFFLFTILLLLRSTTASDPLFHFCSNPQNFTAGSPFASDLARLLARLPVQVPPTGFASGSTGLATGLGLCRGDVKPPECKSCVTEAEEELRERCPYNKAAVIWYDGCLVKYSDERFLGRVDRANRFYMWNVVSVEDPKAFDPKVAELLSGLAREAAGDARLYGVGELGIGAGPDGTLYGLAQCTRDLSGPDCKKCLDDAIGELPNCCAGKRGGRVVGASCYVRYELYPIVDA